MIRIERRLDNPRWLSVAVPAGSLVLAAVIVGVMLAVTGHNPLSTYDQIYHAAFTSRGALSATFIYATPLLFTGLCAAVAFRMRVWNIGGEGQLYMGAVGASGAALMLAGQPTVLVIPAMMVAGMAAGLAWAAIPGMLRAYLRTNEILTSLLLNYVAGLFIYYLIFDSNSYWRDLTSPSARVFPLGKFISQSAFWPGITIGSFVLPLGFLIGAGVAALLWFLIRSTRFGFEMRVIGDSVPAASYAGMRTKRRVVTVMALSGAVAGLRLRRHRRGRARALQPARGRGRGFPHRGAHERGLRAAGPRLPGRAGRHDGGHHLVLRPRRRDARPLPDQVHAGRGAGGHDRTGRGLRRRPGDGHGDGGGPMNHNIAIAIAVSAIAYGTPLLLAGLGELLAERSGVLNLGVEGMMLIGAVCGFTVSQHVHGSRWVALVAALLVAGLAGGLLALIHAFLSVTARANQIVSGLAITIFAGAVGLSSYLGQVWKVGGQHGIHQFVNLNVLGWKNVPILGPILFNHDVMVYLSWALVAAVSWYLYRTRAGLYLRSVGESPQTADTMGINVTAYRYVHTIIGGVLAGFGGAYFTLAIAPIWTDGLTAGDGWIAIALVIFAFWRPDLLVLGAYLFGVFASLGFTLQARGVSLPSEFFSSLPYIMTIVALVAASTGWAKRRLGTPAALGVPYSREQG
jgi:ABC-type uncharacterized transport system permease subunit